MSKANVDLVKRFEELMEAHEAHRNTTNDYGPVLELLDPDIRVRVCESLPHGGDWVGYDEFVQMANNAVAARTVTGEPEYTYLDPDDEHVIVLISFMHKVHETGEMIGPVRMVEVFKFRNGKIASLDPYYADTTTQFGASSEQSAS
jgi:hypothetical protein